jgi:hypothetical protein
MKKPDYVFEFEAVLWAARLRIEEASSEQERQSLLVRLAELMKQVSADPPPPSAGPHRECPTCGHVTYNPNDISEGYCANCKAWNKLPWENAQ